MIDENAWKSVSGVKMFKALKDDPEVEVSESTGVQSFDVQDPDAMCDALLDLTVRVVKLETAIRLYSKPVIDLTGLSWPLSDTELNRVTRMELGISCCFWLPQSGAIPSMWANPSMALEPSNPIKDP